MSIADEATPFGVLVRESYFSPEECAELVRTLAAQASAPTPVFVPERGGYVDAANIRRVRTVEVGAEVRAAVQNRFEQALPDFAAHFGVPLNAIEPVSFLRYGPGDHFQAHRDSSHEGLAKHAARKVSIVVFLNEGVLEPRDGAFTGGELVLCVFGDDPRVELLGIDLRAEPGTLVAFPSSMVHQVRPVTSGERYTLVSWAA